MSDRKPAQRVYRLRHMPTGEWWIMFTSGEIIPRLRAKVKELTDAD